MASWGGNGDDDVDGLWGLLEIVCREKERLCLLVEIWVEWRTDWRGTSIGDRCPIEKERERDDYVKWKQKMCIHNEQIDMIITL